MSAVQILSEEQRDKILEALKHAPDEILLDAIRQCKESRRHIQDSFKEIQGYIGMKAIELPPPRFAASQDSQDSPVVSTSSGTHEPPAEAAPPSNKKPPGVAPSKIGGENKEKILTRCLRPSTAEDVNKFLGRGAGKLEETKGLLRLLWDRGEIQFDGSTYRRKS